MMLQYLEQNFSDFRYKVDQGLRIRGNVAVEVDKGIAVTINFQGQVIRISNGVGSHPDLYLKSSYLLLANVLSGKANPLLELLKGNIKLRAFPKKPFQSIKILQFLKIPPSYSKTPYRHAGNHTSCPMSRADPTPHTVSKDRG